MSEYRPYPSNQLPDDGQSTEVEEESLPRPSFSVEPRDTRAAMPALHDEDDEDVDVDGDEDGSEPQRGGKADRPEPNLDHPGGHLSGTVVRLNRPRRFGFLRTEDGMEIFFHASALELGPSAFDSLRSGQTVEFDCHQDEQGRGLAASLVQLVGPPPAEPARQPRQTREERRQGRGERSDRGERSERGAASRGDHWRVVVLQERYDNPVHVQLERLLNERGIRPGQFTVSLVNRDEGTECWVAYHTGEEGGSKR